MYATLYVARDAVSLSLCHARGSLASNRPGPTLVDMVTTGFGPGGQ